MSRIDLRKKTADSIVLVFVLLFGAIVIGSMAQVTGDPFGIQKKYELIVALILVASSISVILIIVKILRGMQEEIALVFE